MEKRLAPGKHLAKQRILVIAPLQHRVEQKGQQVEAKHTGRQVLLAMPKVVLQMVPLGLEHVVVFVCDLPPPTTRLRNIHNVVIVQAMIGDTAIAYGSPIFKAVPKKRCKALYRALKKSPKSPELAVGAGSEPSYVDRSVWAP